MEKEEDLRENRQLGIEPSWTSNGTMSNLPLPEPWTTRPRLGARHFIRNHTSKYLHAIWKEISEEWRLSFEGCRLKAINLLLSLIV